MSVSLPLPPSPASRIPAPCLATNPPPPPTAALPGFDRPRLEGAAAALLIQQERDSTLLPSPDKAPHALVRTLEAHPRAGCDRARSRRRAALPARPINPSYTVLEVIRLYGWSFDNVDVNSTLWHATLSIELIALDSAKPRSRPLPKYMQI
ncbi:hypothetical protein R3P38DRAFT_2776779 [Favolaschia claudopus]|uniref:Uncharacterized protein n=1 Tax=Favolaschia claudopus TaxID=2862362 RepID=A0AAW0BL59_9AGAR